MCKIDFSEAQATGLEVAGNVTPSVLALAKVAGITAKVLAGAIADRDGIEMYRAEVSTALQAEFVKKAVELPTLVGVMKQENNYL